MLSLIFSFRFLSAVLRSDIKKWLEDVKFEVIGIYEEMTKDSVKADTQRAVFVARKHGTQ